MPRRESPDSLSLAVGNRIRELRHAEGMTIDELAEVTGSKGHLSNIERGLVRPNIYTLQQVAEGLGVRPLDLMTFPKRSIRDRVIDMTRHLSGAGLREAAKWLVDWLARNRGVS